MRERRNEGDDNDDCSEWNQQERQMRRRHFRETNGSTGIR